MFDQIQDTKVGMVVSVVIRIKTPNGRLQLDRFLGRRYRLPKGVDCIETPGGEKCAAVMTVAIVVDDGYDGEFPPYRDVIPVRAGEYNRIWTGSRYVTVIPTDDEKAAAEIINQQTGAPALIDYLVSAKSGPNAFTISRMAIYDGQTIPLDSKFNEYGIFAAQVHSPMSDTLYLVVHRPVPAPALSSIPMR